MDRSLIYSWYEQYKNGIFRYALSITKDPYLAEEVLHDTFVKLLSGGILCAPGKEQAWLYRIPAINVTISFAEPNGNNPSRIHYPIPMAALNISAYATPKLGEEEPTYGGRLEIARILDYVFSLLIGRFRRIR